MGLLAKSGSASISVISFPSASVPFGLRVLLLPITTVDGLASAIVDLISHVIGLSSLSTVAK